MRIVAATLILLISGCVAPEPPPPPPSTASIPAPTDDRKYEPAPRPNRTLAAPPSQGLVKFDLPGPLASKKPAETPAPK